MYIAARYTAATAMLGIAVCEPTWEDVREQSELYGAVVNEYRQAIKSHPVANVLQDAIQDVECIQAVGVEGLGLVFDMLKKALIHVHRPNRNPKRRRILQPPLPGRAAGERSEGAVRALAGGGRGHARSAPQRAGDRVLCREEPRPAQRRPQDRYQPSHASTWSCWRRWATPTPSTCATCSTDRPFPCSAQSTATATSICGSSRRPSPIPTPRRSNRAC